MAEENKKKNFVGVRLSDEEMERLEEVVTLLQPIMGQRSMSDAVRYMIRHFDIESSPLGKSYQAATTQLIAQR